MKIKVADVVLRTREIELPDRCPTCGEDVSYGKGMYLCYVGYNFYDSRPHENGQDVTFQWRPEAESAMSTDHPCTGVFCNHCGEPIHMGHEKEIEVLEEDESETSWASALGRLFFNQ